MNPTGGAVGRRVDGQPNSDEYLLERILSRANLSEAWKRVKANRGAPGVDNMPIDDFMAYAWEHWPEIRSTILQTVINLYRSSVWIYQRQQGALVPWGFPLSLTV